MNNPPILPLPVGWSALLAGLTWAVVTGSLGRFENAAGAPVYVAAIQASGGPGWFASTSAPTGGVVEVLLTSATANILQNGTVNANGSITLGANTYYIQSYWDGTEMTAHAHLP